VCVLKENDEWFKEEEARLEADAETIILKLK
jgi:hypothetical protein